MNASAQAPTVMLVDDDQIDLMQFERMLDQHGGFGKVFSFHRPEDGLEFLGRESSPHIDLLLLDIKMPTISGFKFLKMATTNIGPDFVGAVIILTTLSLDDLHFERAATSHLVKGCFKKPLTSEDLDRAMEIVIDTPPDRAGSTQLARNTIWNGQVATTTPTSTHQSP